MQIYDITGAGTVQPTASYDFIFQNTETSDCPITACTYSDAGLCGSGTFSASADLTDDPSNPWKVSAINTNQAGYEHSICVTCTNGQQTVEMDNWSFKQIKDCTAALENGVYDNITLLHSYEVESATISAPSWDSIFVNTEIEDCPVSTCSI